ncbi:protein TolQ [Paracoccaceae bacterium GXU_MW_L88]
MAIAAILPAQAADFSMLSLFMQAGLVVKIVIGLLIIASVVSWGIILQKYIVLGRVSGQTRRFEDAFWSGDPLDEIYDRLGRDPNTAAERVFSAGMGEWRKSYDEGGRIISGAETRIDRAMDLAINRESERMSGDLPVLATIGSVAPFVGLFGTVWGIKTAFGDIAGEQSTNLAVVAPGIAEALLATALGLVAAIPAVIFYNRLSTRVGRMGDRLNALADEFALILSRQIGRDARGGRTTPDLAVERERDGSLG